MSIIRSAVYSIVSFISLALFLPDDANARDTYFSPNCSSCHLAAKPTCNGCHVHGTHPDFVVDAVGTLNLKASSDKTTYVEGDPIVVKLEGSNMADYSGWVGVRIYDASGLEVTRKQSQLGCEPYPTVLGNKCDLPMELSVPAKLGWTRLYASWAGNVFDRNGAAFGSLLGTTFGAGRRPLRDGAGNQVANHIEEIVATGTFTVTPAPPKPTPEPTPTPTPDPGSGDEPPSTDTGGDSGASSGGGTPSASSSTTEQTSAAGAVDWFFIALLVIAEFGFFMRFTVRRMSNPQLRRRSRFPN